MGSLNIDPSSPSATLEQRTRFLQTARVFMLESWTYPFFPELEFDAERVVRAAKRAGANLIRFMTSLYWAYIQTDLFRMHPDLGSRDLLAETIAAASRAGIHVIPYLNIAHHLPWCQVEDHPDWLKITPDGGVHRYLHNQELLWGVCPMGPYREVIKRYVRQVARYRGIAGIYFDGPYFALNSPAEVCCCPSCREAFRTHSGMDLAPIRATGSPRSVQVGDWENPVLHRMVAWVNDQEAGLLGELNAIVKEEGPYPLIFNRGWSYHEILRSRYSRMLSCLDGAMNERARDYYGNLENCLVPRSAGKIAWNYASLYDRHTRVLDDGLEVVLDGAAALAASGAVIYVHGNRMVFDEERRSTISRVFDFAARNEDVLVDLEPVPYAGILVSESTAEWYGRETPYERYVQGVRSAFQMLHDAHVQAAPLDPPRLAGFERLSRYPVLYLPNNACMSVEEAETLRRYVQEGGGLVASFLTSLYDEAGRKRADFLLADLFGVAYRGQTEVVIEEYLCRTPDCGIACGARLPYNQSSIVEASATARVWGERVRQTATRLGPGLVACTHGKGRVVYLAPAYEANFLHGNALDGGLGGRIPSIRDLVAAAVVWAAGSPPPVQVKAPMTLTANLLHAPGRRVLYLVNRTGDPQIGMNTRIESIVPLRDVDVQVHDPGGELKDEALLLGMGTRLPVARSGGWLRFRVPSIEVFDAVLLEQRHR